MRWYHELAWRIHVWVRPEPNRPRLGRWLSDRIAHTMHAIWFPAWYGTRGGPR